MPSRNRIRPIEQEEAAEAGHGRFKERLRDDLHREIEREVHEETDEERRHIESVAHELKRNTITEIAASEHETRRARRIERTYAFVDFVFFVIYGLVGLMIGLELLGARDGTAFMRFMNTITAPILAPFKGVMPDPSIGSFQLMMSYVIALIVYLLLHRGVKRLFQLLTSKRQVGL
jgi:uncharacterized protein YggT (Ycf19 family)